MHISRKSSNFAGENACTKHTGMESFEIIKIEQLKANLAQAICDGYADYVVNFCDQDGDSVTIDCVYLDEDGDVCLESNETDDNNFLVQELLDELDRYLRTVTFMCTMMTRICPLILTRMMKMIATTIIGTSAMTIASILIHTMKRISLV